jgi:hypothetical protein
MLWVGLVTTVVTILRFTITPTTAVVCFRGVLSCGRIVHTSYHSLLIVPVTVKEYAQAEGVSNMLERREYRPEIRSRFGVGIRSFS